MLRFFSLRQQQKQSFLLQMYPINQHVFLKKTTAEMSVTYPENKKVSDD